jgi:four helix bundle protein
MEERMGEFMQIEDLVVYQKLCQLHLGVCALTGTWPREERFELTSQVRRASNSSPAQLAEKNHDRHVKNKIEGVNRARGEALESVHHLYMGMLKGYHSKASYVTFRDRYYECVRMLNGMERTLERQLPQDQRRFPQDPEQSSDLTSTL